MARRVFFSFLRPRYLESKSSPKLPQFLLPPVVRSDRRRREDPHTVCQAVRGREVPIDERWVKGIEREGMAPGNLEARGSAHRSGPRSRERAGRRRDGSGRMSRDTALRIAARSDPRPIASRSWSGA